MKKDPKTIEETEESIQLKYQELRKAKFDEYNNRAIELSKEMAKDEFMLDATITSSRYGNDVRVFVSDLREIKKNR